MAFMDFMNRGVGGMQQAQGPNLTGGAGVGAARPIGPTYNDLTRAALMYGSKPGSSTPMIASMMPQSNWQQNNLNPLSTEPKTTKVPIAGAEEGDEDTLGSIAKFFMSFLGGV
mgnify:CR=1 FL=1